jgi:hypothetical protein
VHKLNTDYPHLKVGPLALSCQCSSPFFARPNLCLEAGRWTPHQLDVERHAAARRRACRFILEERGRTQGEIQK